MTSPIDPHTILTDALARITEADRLVQLLDGLIEGSAGRANPEWVRVSSGGEVPASVARQYVTHLMRSAELLTEVAKVAASTTRSTE
jgi:hypothetical protein